ncbi:MAG: carboxypeptidase-like regulatory domain-containing protein [Nitrospirota bacterium]|nr:carboxypeptidase-like regulatory domain-containing protein [Nitrospirota bacterium]
MQISLRALLLLLSLSLASCTTKQPDGTIEGSVLPQGTAATITAVQGGKSVQTVPVDANGAFRLTLKPGAYRITASASSASATRSIDNVTVRGGEMFFLPPIDLGSYAGKAVIYGRVRASQPGSEVVLLQEGVERAAIRADNEGRYEFKELPAGEYTVIAKAPGHAGDRARVVIPGDNKVEQNVLLLPISTADGVDWTAGTIRATGIGKPAAGTAGSARRAMAQRAAVADGQRNLLRTIEQLRLDSARTVKEATANGAVATRIQGFVQGYKIMSERNMENGTVEVVLELPLNGPAGLTRMFSE